ncbi:amino acid permease [Myxococcota bacterium]|nr:amino acid permease [Myxococcota bacterium]MBU1431735.1 amino acid permease [Myxococcota bacterium]MBU1898779.1 amino acid permease [Myxococcota bacterium]
MKKLEPTLGLFAVVAISISAMLGSGLFVLPGLAVLKSGNALWAAYLLAAIAVLPAALSKSELATAMPESGGTYVYLNRAFGPLAGTISGLGLWISLLLKSSFALVGFSAYLLVLADLPIKPTSLTLLGGVILLNILGVRKVGAAQKVVVLFAATVLIGLVILGFDKVDPRRLQPLLSDDPLQLIAAAGFVFVSYAGVTKVAAIAEEIKDPDRNLPRGILLSLTLVTILYVAVSATLVGVLPLEALRGDLKPVYSLTMAIDPRFGVLAAVLGVLTMTSMATAGLLASSRFPFAMARNALMPSALKHISERTRTPTVAILATGALMGVAILFLDIAKIAKLASAFQILLFIGVNVTVVLLRESRAQWYKPAYRAPFYPWVQVLGIVLELTLLLMLGLAPLVAILALGLAGLALYYGYGRRRSDARGVLLSMGPRRDLIETQRRPAVECPESAREEAHVVVTLLDQERSPEMLVEIGAALADHAPVQIVHLTEVPEQMSVGDILDDPVSYSLQRRFRAMAEDKGLELRFEDEVTRDLPKTVHDYANRHSTQWMVKSWSRRPAGLLLQNPRFWLRSHLPCNLALFHDTGVRYLREILAYVEPGPDDALVVSTTAHLADLYGARVTFAQFVPNDAPAAQLQARADYLDQIHLLSKIPSKTRVLRGRRFTDALAAASASYDLLVMGAPEEGASMRFLSTQKDKLTARALCSVLRLQTPRQETHSAVSPGGVACPLADFIDPRFIGWGLSATKKEALFDGFAAAFAALEGLSAAQIDEALWERERTQNTGVGVGVAFPHATLINTQRTWLGVYTSAQPIDYQAMDGQPVDVFFVTLGPPSERQAHLQLLATLSRMVMETPLLDELRRARSAEEMLSILTRCAPDA